MKQQRLSLCLSATALVVAVFGSTPLGQAATRVVHSVIPPYAKTAGYAKIAGNAALLNGHKAAVTGSAGTVVVVGPNGKLPASLGAVGPAGPAGAAGPAGPAGVSGYVIVRHEQYIGVGGTHENRPKGEADCPAGTKVLGGAAWVHDPDGSWSSDWNLGFDYPLADGSGWGAQFATGTDTAIESLTLGTVVAFCAKVN